MRKISILITSILIFFTVKVCLGEDISISADVDKEEITLDEQLTLNIRVTGNASNIPNPHIPDLDGFTAHFSGISQNISIINNQITRSTSFTYRLIPSDMGDFTLGPFTVDYQGKTYSAGPINVKVIAAGKKEPSAPPYPYSKTPAEPTQKDSRISGEIEI